jgi:antitoxin MazE
LKLAKWGNSAALRLPAEIIEKMKWNLGDDFRIVTAGDDEIRIVRDRSREQALEEFRKHRVEYDGKFVFDRDEIYGR